MQRPARSPDWQDHHDGPVRAEITSARMAFELGFASLPGWVDRALALRDRLVSPLGLTTVTDGALSMTTLPVLEDTPEHYEVGLEDKHLTFTLHTSLAPNRARVTTNIWFNHWIGRAYLTAVLIPHKIILRHSLKGLT
ncbi:DUF2867 domain-containing protein [Roseobacteraceae bacterium S113]